MHLLIMVLDNVDFLDKVLTAWEGAGIHGVTIIESTGLQRVMLRHRPQAAYTGFGHILGSGQQIGHKTLFAVVEDMAVIEAAVAATERIVGKLEEPNTGIMFTLPVARVWGGLRLDDSSSAGQKDS